jgi:hypothetical protein
MIETQPRHCGSSGNRSETMEHRDRKLSMSIGALISAAMSDAQMLQFIRAGNVSDFSRPKRRRTGKDYPFSSTRQNARYARQIAAGKLHMDGVNA